MKNQLDKAIRRVMAARHAEHRRAAVLVILALLTILSVSWRLHQVGIAMTDDEYSCGYEEHVHSDACYTEVLICGYEDGAYHPCVGCVWRVCADRRIRRIRRTLL